MSEKIFISANELLEDAFELGAQILDSGFKPDLIIGIWRGGAPIAIAIHELLSLAGMQTEHIPIRAQSYTGINQQRPHVELSGLEFIVDRGKPFKRLLLVDDVLDSGQTLTAVKSSIETIYTNDNADTDAAAINNKPRNNTPSLAPEIRIATPWYKPLRNKTKLTPDYYLHTTDAWLVFPHELCGLDRAELLAQKPGIAKIKHHLN